MLDPVDPHENRVARVHRVAGTGIQMARDRQPMLVRNVDHDLELLRPDALGLEATSPVKGPVGRFAPDAVRRHRFVTPAGARRAPVWARAVDAGSRNLT